MRLLYLYPEEWTGRRAREIHTLSTCAALARAGINVTLVTAGGSHELQRHLTDIAGTAEIPGLQLVALARSVGPVRSASIFAFHFRHWLRDQAPFGWGFLIHLKAAAMLERAGIRYVYEAHEIFGETSQKSPAKQHRVAELENKVWARASCRIATSHALGAALQARLANPLAFAVIPNAGLAPLDKGIGNPAGPVIYCGSIVDWKGLDLVIGASRATGIPLKIIGGTESEWRSLGQHQSLHGVTWHPRVPLAVLPQAMQGARAGLIPTQPESASGRYSCPMKLFDYARCGLPVITTALPSLQSLEVGDWCTQVSEPGEAAWIAALKRFQFDPLQADAARTWASRHTWSERATSVIEALTKT